MGGACDVTACLLIQDGGLAGVSRFCLFVPRPYCAATWHDAQVGRHLEFSVTQWKIPFFSTEIMGFSSFKTKKSCSICIAYVSYVKVVILNEFMRV